MLRRYWGVALTVVFFMMLPWVAGLQAPWVLFVKSKINTTVFFFFPYWLFSAAGFLGFKFNLRRVLFISLYFVLGYTLFQNPNQNLTPTTQAFVIASCISFSLLYLLPLINLFGRPGLYNLLAVLGPLTVLALGTKHLPQVFLPLFRFQIPHVPFQNLPHLGMVLAAVFTVIGFTAKDRYLKRFHLYALCSLFPIFYTFEKGTLSHFELAVAFVATGFLLLTGVLKIDWEKVYHDELTEIPNRRALNEALTRLGPVYTIAMVDIDHFKKFNDNYGHEEGDRVLRMVAKHLERGSGGHAYRYGGEEFTLLYDGARPEEMADKIDDIREALSKRDFYIRGKRKTPFHRDKKKDSPKANDNTVTVTISVGVASYADARHIDDVFKAADERLYQAKKKGRNCLVAPKKEAA